MRLGCLRGERHNIFGPCSFRANFAFQVVSFIRRRLAGRTEDFFVFVPELPDGMWLEVFFLPFFGTLLPFPESIYFLPLKKNVNNRLR